MAITAHPNEADLREFLIANNVLPNPIGTSVLAFLRLQQKCDASRSTFEELAGRRLIAVQQTRTFPLPRTGIVNLNADLSGTPVVQVSGITKTADLDYELLNPNADLDGQPWWGIRFMNPGVLVSTPRPVSVAGLWGLPSYPEAAWESILQGAAWLCIPALRQAKTNGLLQLVEGDVEKRWGQGQHGFLTAEEGQWKRVFEDGVNAFSRVTFGITG
jgi:hypothetical protein